MKAGRAGLRMIAPGLAVGLGFAVAAAQMNTSLPPKQPAAPTAPAADCRPSAHLSKDGTLEFTNCSGSKEHVEKDMLLKPGKAAAGSDAAADAKVTSPPLDPQTNQRYQESLRASYDFQIYSYTQAKKTFDWQYWSSKVIFWVVLLLVGAGLAFSALQFYLGYRAGTAKAEESTFEATLQGVKVSSSVLGVIVLTISIVFFYLYLKYVYPITNVGP
jgi:hypothetical protein